MILAYYDYFSIISIFIVLGFVGVSILGYKFGFAKRLLKLASPLCGFIFAILFCGGFSKLITYPIFGDNLHDKFYNNVITSDAYANFSDKTASASFYKELGLPKFISNIIADGLSIDQACDAVATALAKFVCIIISFFILLIGMSVIFFFLKKLIDGLRKAFVIRLVDGICGIVFYNILFYLLLCIVMVILSLVMQESPGLNNFISNDFSLATSSFRISKYFYSHNLLGNFFRLFF